ncbi:MAG: TonB-dependent receptor [Acidobacteriaceae bacterium]
MFRWSGTSALSMLVLFAMMFTASFAHAQFRTSVQGVVTDPTGAVIPGATLTLKNNSTNETVVRTSNDAGVFNFNALPADVFTLTVDRAGFQEKVLDHLQFIPEQANALNVQLGLAGTTQQVTVNASTEPALDQETANIGGTITSNDINHMPSWNRDVFTLTQLAPGAISDGSQSAGGGVNSNPGTQGPGGSGNGGQAPTENGPQANANGGQYETNSISIDGISTVSAVWGGTTVITPDPDSVGNIRIVTNDYDAENGRFSGAQTLITSKSGTNTLHGSAFLGIYRPGLNAYQHTIVEPDGSTNPQRDTARFDQYGGSIGGPFWKNRVFGFFDFESSPDNSTTTGTGWYDTAAFDALGPTGSIASTFLTFPGAGVTSTGIVPSTCAGIGLVEGTTCNTIAGQGLNIGSPLNPKLYPLGTQDPTATGTTAVPGVGGGLTNVADIADYATESPFTSYYRQYNGRLDAQVTQKDHAAFAIYWVPQGNTSYNGGSRAYNLFHHAQVNDAFSVIWNHTFSSSFLNEARANAAGWRWNEIASNPQQPVGLPQDQVNQIGSITINQFGSSLGSDLNQWTYGYKDTATKIVGEQTIKFGADYTNLHYLNNPIGRPNYNFYDIWDFLNDAPELEAGNFNTVTGSPGGARQDDRENLFGAFVQDDWKIRPNLTLHGGIRYSYFGSLYTKQNNLSVVQFGAGSAFFTGINMRQGGNLWTPQKGNFGPQLGFNWSPEMFHDKLVVRGGYGLNFNQEEIAISANSGGNPPSQGYYTFQYSSPSNPGANGTDILYGISSSPTSLNGFASNPNTITAYNSNNLPTGGNASITAVGNTTGGLPTAYSYHYSLGADYEIKNWLVASLGYQGSASHHLITQENANANALVLGVPLNPLVTSTDYYPSSGASNNNAMLAELKHPMSHHFQLDAQFMWSKSMDDGSGPYEEDPYYPASPRYAWGRSDFNVGKQFKAFGLWQPVIFHGHGWLEKVAGGWSLSGIFNVHTGFGWTPNFGIGQSLYCSTCGYQNLRPQYLGGAGKSTSNKAFESGSNWPNYAAVATAANAAAPTATVNGNSGTVVAYSNQYFNVPNFEAAMTGTFPAVNAALPPPPGMARNSFDGPGYKDFDASLTKKFGLPKMRILGENASFEIRADAFNLFNNTNLNGQDISNNINATNFGQVNLSDSNVLLGSRTVTFQGRFEF